MEEYIAESFDVAIIGGGHAGAEAAFAAARLGMKTVLFSMSLDFIANLPCNPSIGGTAKGHLVREIDALGGEMGKAADRATIQSRMLNKGKGPAVHSLRVQADRWKYHTYIKQALENQENLYIKQHEIVEIRVDNTNSINSVVTSLGTVFPCKTAILCTGTFLGAEIFVGKQSYTSGPDGLHASTKLSDSLRALGIELRRFKTGTPARVHRDSIDFSKLEPQDGDEHIVPFSFETTGEIKNRVPCYIAYTNKDTHQLIADNINESLFYSGEVEWVGARYCPSIEDKVVRFADKDRHQLFVEPMGLDTKELYIQGLSTSFPEKLQERIYRTVEGFENAELMRGAYAIEYDCIDPLVLKPSLEFKDIHGLYGAGQINGTSGYEEAAAQGMVAGINASHQVQGKEPLILERSSSYIGTLIDDLVTKGCNDPYRMMTSRSEYRLLLRQDNADARLTPTGRELGLISDERWKNFLLKQQQIKEEKERINAIGIGNSKELDNMLDAKGTTPVTDGARLVDLLRRPEITYKDLAPFDPERPELPYEVAEQVEISIKYQGYIDKQLKQVERMHQLEKETLPEDIDYAALAGLRLEAREKLAKVKPLNLGQASRISGVSPADVSVLMIYLEQQKRKGE